MAFEITYEAVEMMRNLAKKIPNSVDAIHQSNVEVIKCYESVRNTLGPHTRKIEAIVVCLIFVILFVFVLIMFFFFFGFLLFFCFCLFFY